MRSFFVILLLVIFCNVNLAQADEHFKHGIAVFGDLKYPANFKHFDYVNPDAPKRGTVRFGVEGTFNSLNPFILKGIAPSSIDAIYDSLCEGSSDEISSCYGLIAESMSLSDDKFSLTFKLRQNAFFHDGKKISADDVIFTFNKLISEGHPSYKIAYSQVKEVKKINDYEVKFIFKTNENRDLPMLVAGLKILPKHYYQDHKFDETNLTPPLGSGPYRIKKVEQGKTIVYERVKNYWAQNLPVNKGRNNFDEIIYDYYRDSNVLIEAFKAGKFDFRQENISRNWHNSYNIEKVKNGEIVKKEITHGLPTATQMFVLNLRKEKFQNLEFRKAMTLAFNFEWLNKHIFYSSYKRTNSYFENSIFKNQEGFKLLASDENDFGRENLIIAKNILEKAGYKVVNQKLIDPKTNEPISIEFLIDSQSFEMIVAPLIKNLRKLGIDAKMRFIEENQYEAKVRNFDFDVIVAVHGQSLIPSSELIRYWHSSQKDIPGSMNLSGLNDKKIDELVTKISKAKNKTELISLCGQFDYEMLTNYYTILQWHNNTYRLLYRDIFAMPKITPKYALAIDSWWIK